MVKTNFREEFEALYQDHYREVWALAYSRLRDPNAALDITQEAFLRLWKQREAGEPIRNPRAWLLRVARNLAEDYAKSAFRRNGTHSPEIMNGLRSREPAPPVSLECDERVHAVRRALGELTPRDRELLLLNQNGDPYEQLAERYGITAKAVKARLSRIRKRLRRLLKHFGPNHQDGALVGAR